MIVECLMKVEVQGCEAWVGLQMQFDRRRLVLLDIL